MNLVLDLLNLSTRNRCSCCYASPVSRRVYLLGEQVGHFVADIVVEDRLILELKTGEAILKVHETQLKNYLRATHIEVGLVLCFGERALLKRMILTNDRKSPAALPPS